MKLIKIILTSVVFVSVAILGFLIYSYVNIHEYEPTVAYTRPFDRVEHLHTLRLPMPATLDELKNSSANVVRGRIGNDARNVYQFNYNFDPPIRIGLANTHVSLEILEVFKGNLVVGETITLVEPYSISYGTLRTWGNYMPSTPYEEYIFFLCEPFALQDYPCHYGSFILPFCYMSRFPIQSEATAMRSFDMVDLTIEHSPTTSGNPIAYMYMWQDVLVEFVE
ncbi:MAG: hypothetical protein FWC78_03685 [Defluviitaleaceae bacterium]|nr:hypothetical protein [Defluviitaleaceae bacterium]